MNQVLKLRTMYCGTGTADKIYVIAIVKLDNGFHKLFTIHGPRGKTPNVRLIATASNSSPLVPQYFGIARAKSREYNDCDWKNDYYGLKQTVYDLGTPPGGSELETPAIVPNTRKTARSRNVRPAAKAQDDGRSLDIVRDF